MRIAHWSILWICLTASSCCQPVEARSSSFLKISSSLTPKGRTSTRILNVDTFTVPRGGDAVPTERKVSVWDILCDPRVALKTLSVALGCFGVELLCFPVMFRDTFLKNLPEGGSPSAMDFLQYLLGIRELSLSFLFWKSAQDGTDETCRLLVTMAFWTMSLPQVFYIIRYDVLKNTQVRKFMLKLYGFFFWLSGIAMLRSWNQLREQEAAKKVYNA